MTGIVFHRPVFVGKEIDEYRAWKKSKQESKAPKQLKTYHFVGTARLHLRPIG